MFLLSAKISDDMLLKINIAWAAEIFITGRVKETFFFFSDEEQL